MSLAKKKAKKAEPEVVINFPQKYYIIGADLSLKRPGFCKLTMEDSKLTDIHLMSVDNKKDLIAALKGIAEGPILVEVKVKKGNRKDLGRPTTTPIQNKEVLMSFLAK